MVPATGSTMTPAISSPIFPKSSRTASASLYCSVSVYFARSAGTPLLLGLPVVSIPEPALISRLSPWPW